MTEIIKMSLGEQFKFLKNIALSNPKGIVEAFGNWDGKGIYLDIINDIKKSFSYLNNVPYIIMMSPETYSDFVSQVSFDNYYKISMVFDCIHNKQWLSVSDEYDDDCVLVIAKPRYYNQEYITGINEKTNIQDISNSGVVLIEIR